MHTAFRGGVGAAIAAALLSTAAAQEIEPVPVPVIAGYDITNSFLGNPGPGNWTHTYSRLPLPAGDPFLYNYAGGIGTMADGYIPIDHHYNQLLTYGSAHVLTLHLVAPMAIEFIDIYGGYMAENYSPGRITGARVAIGGSALDLHSVDWGVGCIANLCNDRLILTGTPLAGLVTDTVVLSDFVLGPYDQPYDVFNIGEITLNNLPNPRHFYPNPSVDPVPEPAAWALLLGGLGVLGWRRRGIAALEERGSF